MLSIDLFNVIFITAFVGLFLETYYKYLQTLTLQILLTIRVCDFQDLECTTVDCRVQKSSKLKKTFCVRYVGCGCRHKKTRNFKILKFYKIVVKLAKQKTANAECNDRYQKLKEKLKVKIRTFKKMHFLKFTILNILLYVVLLLLVDRFLAIILVQLYDIVSHLVLIPRTL